jgi:SAM-dependent methyltransferase
MLAEARRRHPGLEFRAGSAEELPFADGEFDAVVGNFVLHHSGRPDRVLDEAYRVLRPGGRTAFAVWADPSELEAFGLFFAAVEEHVGMPDLPHGPLFGVSDFAVFREMAVKARFRDPRVEKLDIAWKTPSIDSFLAAFRDWADLGALPADSRDAIERSVRDKAEGYRRNGAYTMPNPAILLSAVK